jgi:hypothetical protein
MEPGTTRRRGRSDFLKRCGFCLDSKNGIGSLWKTQATTGAEARLHFGLLRGAEAPLFHVTAGIADFITSVSGGLGS